MPRLISYSTQHTHRKKIMMQIIQQHDKRIEVARTSPHVWGTTRSRHRSQPFFPYDPTHICFSFLLKRFMLDFVWMIFASIPIPSLSPFPSFGFLPSVGFGRSYKSHKCYTCGWCVMCTSDLGMCGPPPVEMESDLAIIEFSWAKSVRMPKGGYVLTTLFFVPAIL